MFAVFYGLDWIATVPPTVRLTANVFGKENVGVVFGWIAAAHQLGAATAAFGAGMIRTVTGDYLGAFVIAGGLCVLAALMSLAVGWRLGGRRGGDGDGLRLTLLRTRQAQEAGALAGLARRPTRPRITT